MVSRGNCCQSLRFRVRVRYARRACRISLQSDELLRHFLPENNSRETPRDDVHRVQTEHTSSPCLRGYSLGIHGRARPSPTTRHKSLEKMTTTSPTFIAVAKQEWCTVDDGLFSTHRQAVGPSEQAYKPPAKSNVIILHE